MKRIFLDTETTGLSPEKNHRIVEIAAIAYDDRNPVGESDGGIFHRQLNPQREIEAEAVNIHGLTNEMLQDKPLFADIADDFAAFVEGGEIIIHNAEFDEAFLNHELAKVNLPKLRELAADIICSLNWSRQNLPGVGSHSLDSLCAHFGVDNSARTSHNALLDTQLLAKVYFLMTARQGEMELRPRALSNTQAAGEVKVIKASEEEQAAHLHFLQEMKKEKNITPLFLRGAAEQ